METALDDDAFNAWALRVFRYQVAANPVFRRFARGRGCTPGTVTHWTRVPAVPTTAFKHVSLVSGDPGAVERTFLTSGTTGGVGDRGRHLVPSLALYRASLLSNFAAHVLPAGERLPLVCLLPSPEAARDSSLSTMMGIVEEELAAPGGGWFVYRDTGLDIPGLHECLGRLREEGRPVLLVGTAFSFVHWVDVAVRDGTRFHLPEGSRIMETGGFKGRARTLSRGDLYAAVSRLTGVAPEGIVNEYGMTELLSQFYEPVLVPGRGPERRHVPPPWVRTRVLDPVTLEARPPGEPGILCHVDLANAGSVVAVLTEDRGVAVDGGFRVLGREVGAEPRGCSLALEEILGGSRG